jgi:hypothetical protein
MYNLELLRASEGTLSRWSRLHLQSPTNPHWVRVVGYGPFSLRVIHKESLCPAVGALTDDEDDGTYQTPTLIALIVSGVTLRKSIMYMLRIF